MREEQKHITREELSHLAALAQLELGEKERELFSADLDAILAMVADLAEADGEAVSPDAVPLTALRPDTVGTSLCREAVLANAADSTDAYIAVPRVVE